jgi:GNAT superfamily N-acetyltransferase
VGLQVREARLTDIDRITVLFGTQEPGRVDVHADDVADALRQLVYLPSATVLVALDDRRMLGLAALALRPSVRNGGLVGTIDLLLVDPAFTGDGVGQALVTGLLRSARNKGCVLVEAALPDDPEERALLEGHGFIDAIPELVHVVSGARALVR